MIRTAQRNFTVVQVLRTTADGTSSVCRDVETGKCYVLNRFPDTGDGLRCLPLLVAAKNNHTFQDMIQVFTQNGEIWSQFEHTDAPTLGDRLRQHTCTLQERLEMGSNILQQLVMQSMPGQMATAVLNHHHILVDDALGVHFRYVIDVDDLNQPEDMNRVWEELRRVFVQLFATEREAQSAPLLEGYLKQLSRGAFATYLEAYAAFDPIRTELLALSLQGKLQPQTWLFRMWARVKSWVKYVKPLLIGLLLVASFCYLVYTMLLPKPLTGTPLFFDAIGTVEILPQNMADLS